MNEKFGVGWLDESPRSPELEDELDAGTDALRRAINTTWWSWDSGSQLSSSGDGQKIFNLKLKTERLSEFLVLYRVIEALKV
jgi:hypothetical protein